MVSLAEIDKTLREFWEIDVGNDTTQELEQECESHFKETHSRLPDGRYQVRLPFKSDNELQLGNSRGQAIARYLFMERKFNTNPELRSEYSKFMQEYESLGHMTMVPDYLGPPQKVYYLPHHAVFKMDSTTTKVRVVFDASYIEKMFRQISLQEEDRDFHRILWRENPREAIREYQLNTVTYGTGPATFLSVRVLKQLAMDEGHKFPKAAAVLQ
ncbi:uncharacterized protein LOC129809338 [Phlebotomus papatasi]|uniref:uncharacterized protein LOC129809338 n=1 Tax=Phlebotomus papatasi TaxID=29031 RepID=UPI0024839437|nr:uncharacterized protein LOC129809338 [Phlebotomus papatasi]